MYTKTQFVHSDAVMYVQNKKWVRLVKKNRKTNAFRYNISKYLRANTIQYLRFTTGKGLVIQFRD